VCIVFKKSKSLKLRFLQVIIIIFVVTIILSLSLIYYTLSQKVNNLSEKFAIQYALKEKSRITAPIEKEIALVQNLVDAPLLRKWAQDEKNDQLMEKAIEELEVYRKNFQDSSYFFIIDESQNYYFNNKQNEYENNQYRYTLDNDNKDDQWYFATMKQVDDYHINMNYDRALQKTKLWIDAIIYNKKGKKIGMAGTGFSLDSFIQDFLKSKSEFITPLLFDSKGYIRAYQDTNLIQMATINKKVSKKDEKTIFKFLKGKDADKLQTMMNELTDNAEEVSTIQFHMQNDKRIAAVTYIKSMDWYMMTLLDTSEIFSIWDFLPTIAVLILSLLVIVLAIIFFINKFILHPIGDLTDFTEVIAKGNYDKKIAMDYENEFGTLAESFNKMTDTINKHTNHLEELVDQRTRELKKSNTKLSAKNKKIMDNINYAQHIQGSILPAKNEINVLFE
jgi:HAMP domain-containing protein